MTYFVLPIIHNVISPQLINIQFDSIDNENVYINKSLSFFLNEIKEQINEYNSYWDNAKKFINPYEFIHTNIPGYNYSISKYRPISRAFFKILEIYNTFNIIDKRKKVLNSFHLAEGPGGFIEATSYLRSNKLDTYYGMSLIDENNHSVPGWKKADIFLKKNKNVIIERGKDNTGNLFNPDNYKYCYDKYKNSMDIITGDGGFDFSIDYNRQEGLAIRLLITQIAYAVAMQNKNGVFILKMFDLFLLPSFQIVYLLSTFYKKVFIIKPNTSRYANSEKYIVCLGFKNINNLDLVHRFYQILSQFTNTDFEKYSITSLFNFSIQSYYKISIREINCILGTQQIENILNTIKFIINKDKKKDKIDNIKIQNAQKCIRWCVKNNIPYNIIDDEHKNIFLKKSN
jgi:23S rRNA U2552 (ribose-2'-O)-methylase RlmE/FtsJ